VSDLDQRTARIRAGIVICSLCLASSHNRNMSVEVGAIDVSIATCTILFCLAALVLAAMEPVYLPSMARLRASTCIHA
jgi:hypothetical protein